MASKYRGNGARSPLCDQLLVSLIHVLDSAPPHHDWLTDRFSFLAHTPWLRIKATNKTAWSISRDRPIHRWIRSHRCYFLINIRIPFKNMNTRLFCLWHWCPDIVMKPWIKSQCHTRFVIIAYGLRLTSDYRTFIIYGNDKFISSMRFTIILPILLSSQSERPFPKTTYIINADALDQCNSTHLRSSPAEPVSFPDLNRSPQASAPKQDDLVSFSLPISSHCRPTSATSTEWTETFKMMKHTLRSCFRSLNRQASANILILTSLRLNLNNI